MSANQHGVHRLGKRQLGRHAFEECMPKKIVEILNQENGKNWLKDVIPKLAQLLQQDHNIEVAYLCTDRVVQISKLKHEGAHFCGYRNIQMMLSSLPDDFSLSQKEPGVLVLQDMIEHAWDEGFNSHGRIATGGICGTRKHIGTSEAEALFLSINVPCTGHVFEGKDAWPQLLDFVEQHFSQSTSNAASDIMVQTGTSPLFLQRPGHSLTIIGIERNKNGKRRLLCFDPAWQPPSMMQKSTLPTRPSCLSWQWKLKMYRKNERYLRRYSAFEALVIGLKRNLG